MIFSNPVFCGRRSKSVSIHGSMGNGRTKVLSHLTYQALLGYRSLSFQHHVCLTRTYLLVS